MMTWKRDNRSTLTGFVALALIQTIWAASGTALPILSEVYYDAVGSDDGQIFVEIAGAPGTSLEGFTLEGINGSNGAAGPTIELAGVIGVSGLFVVADQTSAGTSSVAGAQLLANFDFQNGPDSVVLRLGETLVDALGYGVFAASEIFAGEGAAAPDVSPGSSLARVFADLDTDDNLADFIVLTTPTPGIANFSSIPEPGAALMIGLGLSGLTMAGGRQSSRSRPTLRVATQSIRRKRAWQREWTGTISERVEHLAPERPSFWTQEKS
jgi:hypothetical protein